MNEKTEYNTLLDFIRFFASLGILSHHAYLIGAQKPYFMMSGYMFVSLFFMITGYLTLMKLKNYNSKNISDKVLSITINKVRKVYFFTILIVIFEYIYFYITTKNFSMPSFIFEILLLYFFAPQKFNILLPHLWFLSSLFLALPIFSALYLKHKDFFKNILCWLLPAFILCYLMNNLNSLAIWNYNFYFITSGFMLAIAGLFLGGCIYFLSEKIKNIKFNYFAKIFFTIIFILNIIFIVSFTSSYYQNSKDLITLISIFTLLLFTASNITIINIPSNKFINKISKICLPLYVSHWFIGNVLGEFNLNISYKCKYIIFLISSITMAMLLLSIQKLLSKINIKKLFVIR